MKSFDQWIESVLHATKAKSYFKITPLGLFACISGGVLMAGVAFIQILSQNQISINSSRVRFEPSSSVGGAGSAWVTSWEEFVQSLPQPPNLPRGYTSAWNGQWTSPSNTR